MSEEISIPKWLVLPTVAVANQAATAQTGSLAISGAKLVFHNGTAWQTITSA